MLDLGPGLGIDKSVIHTALVSCILSLDINKYSSIKIHQVIEVKWTP